MTDGYGPPALILFWIGLAAFYIPKLRRTCRPGLRRLRASRSQAERGSRGRQARPPRRRRKSGNYNCINI